MDVSARARGPHPGGAVGGWASWQAEGRAINRKARPMPAPPLGVCRVSGLFEEPAIALQLQATRHPQLPGCQICRGRDRGFRVWPQGTGARTTTKQRAQGRPRGAAWKKFKKPKYSARSGRKGQGKSKGIKRAMDGHASAKQRFGGGSVCSLLELASK